MVKVVVVGTGLFVLAVLVVLLTHGEDLAALSSAFLAAPLLDEVAWAVIVLVPLVVLPCAVWLCDTLMRQRQAAQALALRLDGVRQGVKELAKTQIGAEATIQHLVRTDPEDAIGVMRQRLSEAERIADVQQGRNDFADLETRVHALGVQQQTLRDRLTPVLEQRRAIERHFLELDTRQTDIARALDEIASGDDAVALDIRLKKLTEFVRHGHARCDEIEQAAKSIAGLKEGFAELHARLAPLAAVEDGIKSRLEELNEDRDILAADIEAMQRTHQGPLADRVRSLADDKNRLDDGVSAMNLQFSKLATLRRDVDALFVNFDRALRLLAIADDDSADVDTRVEQLSKFIAATQIHIEDIERKLAVFSQLRAKLGELQSRLARLDAPDDGVASVIEAVNAGRDELVAKIERLEHGDDGDLVTRVKTLTETKRELEDRVANLTEHFGKLATIRRDITGLFDKLSSAVGPASS